MSTSDAPAVPARQQSATPGSSVPLAAARQLAALAALALATLVLATVAHRFGNAWLAAVATGMGAGLVLGSLVAGPQRLAATAGLALSGFAGFAGGATLAGVPLLAAATTAAAPVLAALLAHVALRARKIAPAGLRELAPAAAIAAIALALLPLAVLAASLLAAASAAAPSMQQAWHAWLGGALGVLATLPPLLASPLGHDAPSAPPHANASALGALAWLPLPALLWWQPSLLVLGLLPMLLVAARVGPRTIAALGLLTGLAIAARSALPAAPDDATLAHSTLLACTMLLAALAIAILASQREQAARALAASRDHLRAVTERSTTLVATLDAEGLHRFANHSYLKWLGMEAGDVLGQSLQQVYGAGDTAVSAPFRRALAGQPQRQQVHLADGRALDAHFEPRFSADGPIDGVHLLAQDASWRSAQERTLEAVLAAALDATVVVDAGGNIVRLNDKTDALFGGARRALLGQPLAAWLEPAAVAAVRAALARVCVHGEPQLLPRSLDLHARRADGTAFPVELQLAPTEGSRAVQAVVTVQDIGPRLAWEQMMVDTRSQSEVTLNAIDDAVVACDLQQRITVFNPAATRISGWPEHAALGQPLGEVLRFIDVESGAEVAPLLGEALKRNAAIRKHEDRLLVRRDGERVAVAESAAPIRDRFGQASGGVLLLHDVSQSHAQAQTLTHQAQHDHLTGLPNRVLLQDRLSQALAQMDRGYKGALLYLDLDHFKPINDRLGHPVGDRVLQEIATRLRAGVREDDTVSRQGGDEFVLLLVRLADPRDAARVAGKLVAAIEQPIHIDGHELQVSASIGIALFPQDGRDTATVTRNADAALYHAKEGGRGRYSYFTDIMSASAEERMRTEHDLRIALSNHDFELAWQPQVQLSRRSIVGVEALLRWRQFDGSLVLPEEFIQVAEETGLVVAIDEWVLHAACTQARDWQQDWSARGITPVPVSVNVSLARFDGDRLLAHVRAVLAATGLQPHWLEIEFKGAQLFAHGARGQALVADLKAMGVRVAADDFGSGQASLGALANFAFDTLKVDRGFVQAIVEDPHAHAVTEAVLGIGQAMGYRVVAKGVETDAQYGALVQMGCDGMQGLMFGDAGPAERFSALLARGGIERTAISP